MGGGLSCHPIVIAFSSPASHIRFQVSIFLYLCPYTLSSMLNWGFTIAVASSYTKWEVEVWFTSTTTYFTAFTSSDADYRVDYIDVDDASHL